MEDEGPRDKKWLATTGARTPDSYLLVSHPLPSSQAGAVQRVWGSTREKGKSGWECRVSRGFEAKEGPALQAAERVALGGVPRTVCSGGWAKTGIHS